MSDVLSLSEQRGGEAIQTQTDQQLLYTFKQFTESEDEFDFVDYMCIADGGMAFAVPKKFFIWAIYDEMYYRGLVK